MTSILSRFSKYAKYEFHEIALKNRETCHHWIDYEIYDALDERLKQKYIESVGEIELYFRPEYLLEKAHIGVRCRANNKDEYHISTCDCSENYKKTCNEILTHIKENGLVCMNSVKTNNKKEKDNGNILVSKT